MRKVNMTKQNIIKPKAKSTEAPRTKYNRAKTPNDTNSPIAIITICRIDNPINKAFGLIIFCFVILTLRIINPP